MAESRLGAFFRPRSVALVGASDKSAWSALIHSRFAMWDFEGQLFAVNRNGVAAHGVPGFKSCRDIPEPVDMAYVFVPVHAAADAMRDVAAAGIRNAVFLTSGFSEAGPEGAALQAEVLAVARAADIRLLGPNSLGFANVAARAVTTSISTRQPVRPGRLGIISQSGAIAQEIYNVAHGQGIGVGFIAATGNEADLGIADLVDHLVDDPAIGAILLYTESIRSPERFIAAATRAFDAAKPLVMLKLGRSEISAEIAQAHTGSLMGDDRAFDAMCHRHGISRVSSIEELVATGALLEKVGPISPPRIGMLSLSGGACAVYADLAHQHGLLMPPFAPETVAALRAALPPFAAPINPLDVTGVVVNDPSVWSKVIPALTRDPGLGLIVTTTVVPNTESEIANMRRDVEAMARAYGEAGCKPVLAAITTQDQSAERRAFLEAIGIDIFISGLDTGVRALAHLQRWSERLLAGRPGRLEIGKAADRPVGERETLAYLARFGVPVIPATLVHDAGEAAREAERLAGKVVLKIASPDLAHKTEAGGVHLDLSGGAAAARAFDRIMASVKAYAPDAKIDGVIVSPMRPPAVELIVGIARDPEWGPVLAVGFGGVMAEILKDSRVRLLPVTEAEVKEMLLSLRLAPLLQGFRGAPAADLDRLAAVIMAIGDAALALGPKLAALEINPLRVNGDEIEALDALAIYGEP